MSGSRFAVGVTVVPVDDPAWEPVAELPVDPFRAPEMLPGGRSAADNARWLEQITAAEAMLAGLRVRSVMELAAARPASADRRPGQRGAAAGEVAGPGRLDGVSEFFADELALVLNCSRTAASTLIDACEALWEKLPATLAALDAGTLDWPRARAIAEQLGHRARGVAPAVIAEVEAAVLPGAGELSIRQLIAAVRRELISRDAAASDRRRADAERGCDVTVRPLGDGVSELVARMPAELAAACRRTVDQVAWAAREAGDDRPLGVLRAGALADFVLQPWDDEHAAVTAIVTVEVPLAALTPHGFLAEGGPVPAAFSGPGAVFSRPGAAFSRPGAAFSRPGAAFSRPGAVAEPTGAVDGEPITAAHLRRLLEQLDTLCPGGLRAPAGGRLQYAFSGDAGGLRAVATDEELRRLARRGCPDHPTDPDRAGRECGCPVLGAPAELDRYRPSAHQVRFVRTRDRTCRHPGCANSAGWSDCDHVVPHGEGGATDCANLASRQDVPCTQAEAWKYPKKYDGRL
ncbi:HNH endonuclease signature motif containing protein [Trujillonella endophytica]|uniref:DUF222 domain-containing protein n=1 Tax=Trujillonella endophytica TaxID=673521 RepID=A0A1H8SXT4_9ACTN|nr:HNH endonuclease signature motif containing protein [Trujillella endophytica]SEO83570.1 protein of unknown function [Trujillella endophytica]